MNSGGSSSSCAAFLENKRLRKFISHSLLQSREAYNARDSDHTARD